MALHVLLLFGLSCFPVRKTTLVTWLVLACHAFPVPGGTVGFALAPDDHLGRLDAQGTHWH